MDISAFLNQPKNIFLVDGSGALLSALLLGLLVWSGVSGMPEGVLVVLGGIAGLFAVYSLGCYLFVRASWRAFLKIIMAANVLYCFVTIGLVVKYYGTLTPVGVAYFVGEVVVICVLVGVERRVLMWVKN